MHASLPLHIGMGPRGVFQKRKPFFKLAEIAPEARNMGRSHELHASTATIARAKNRF